MRTSTPRALAGAAALAVTAVALAAPATGTAGLSFQKVATLKGSIDPQLATTRNANGTLTLVYPSFTGSLHVTGLATRTISAAGKVGARNPGAVGLGSRRSRPRHLPEREPRGVLRRDLARKQRVERLGDHLERRRNDLVGAG